MANEGNLKPFQKGDRRINRKGRPKDFAKLRELARAIAHESLETKQGQVTIAEAILRGWAGDKKHQKDFMEYAFGKVPDEVKQSGEVIIKIKREDK